MAQVIGQLMGIGGTVESRPIEILIVQLDVEQRVRTEGRVDPLVGHLVSLVRFVFAVQGPDPFGLFFLPGDERHDAFNPD